MGFVKELCKKIACVDDYVDEIKELKKEINQRDLTLRRIKMVATGNHYGYSQEDKEYREKYCINLKLKKIFELACKYDKNDELDFWDKLNELEKEIEEGNC